MDVHHTFFGRLAGGCFAAPFAIGAAQKGRLRRRRPFQPPPRRAGRYADLSSRQQLPDDTLSQPIATRISSPASATGVSSLCKASSLYAEAEIGRSFLHEVLRASAADSPRASSAGGPAIGTSVLQEPAPRTGFYQCCRKTPTPPLPLPTAALSAKSGAPNCHLELRYRVIPRPSASSSPGPDASKVCANVAPL